MKHCTSVDNYTKGIIMHVTMLICEYRNAFSCSQSLRMLGVPAVPPCTACRTTTPPPGAMASQMIFYFPLGIAVLWRFSSDFLVNVSGIEDEKFGFPLVDVNEELPYFFVSHFLPLDQIRWLVQLTGSSSVPVSNGYWHSYYIILIPKWIVVL